MRDLLLELRKRMGMNQEELAVAVGIARSSLQNYERPEPSPKAAVIERLAAFAESHGHKDLADQFRGQTLTNRPSPDRHRRWYALLNEVLVSGNAEAISAVTKNLEIFARYVRLGAAPVRTGPPAGARRKTGTTGGDP